MNIQKTTALIIIGLSSAASAYTVFSGTSADSAGLTGVVDDFKRSLNNGTSTAPNAPAPVTNVDGFRAINWDAAPDGISDPNAFPGDFFNFNASPRARGMAFSGGAGTTFALSSTAASGTGVNFSSFNASYASIFQTFSPERLFSPVGSNAFTIDFFSPADPTQSALVDGFGAVFTDVDLANTTTLTFRGLNGDILAEISPEVLDNGLSFAGIHFDTEGSIVASVDVVLGNAILGANDGPGSDVVVLDDFIAGEMQAVPEPSSTLLFSLSSLVLLRRRR